MDINVFAAPLSRVKSGDGNGFKKKRGKEKEFLVLPLAKLSVLSTFFYHLIAGQSEKPLGNHLRACISLYVESYQHD